ncbi:MAG: hypothetical protein KF857_06910 [Fimbriimonadaceae bacterium]|nr:hypothetical protein [Fimbriimonadaceae bacterium]
MFSAVTVALCMTQIAAGVKLAGVAPPAPTPATAPVATATTATSTTPAAKPAEGSFDYDIANFTILQDKQVQKDLGITEEVRAKLNKHAEWFNGELKVLDAAFKKVRESNPKAQPPNDKVVPLQKELKKRVFADLTAAQIVRLREITVQSAGDAAVLDPRVGKAIGLSDATTKALRDRFQANAKKAQTYQQEINKEGGELQQKYLKPLIEKYGNTQPKDQAESTKRQNEAKAALEPHKAEFEALQRKLQSRMGDLEKDFHTFVEGKLDAKQKASLAKLKGKEFKAG